MYTSAPNMKVVSGPFPTDPPYPGLISGDIPNQCGQIPMGGPVPGGPPYPG